MTFEEWRKRPGTMIIRRVWIKTIGENASIAITNRGKRRVTLPNCSACARQRLLRRAEHLMYPAFDWSITNLPRKPSSDRGGKAGSYGRSNLRTSSKRSPKGEERIKRQAILIGSIERA
jgi:hypothetical protein